MAEVLKASVMKSSKHFWIIFFLKISVDENADFSSLNLPLLDEAELIPCTSWEYDTSFWKKTIIMDFDLVCEVRIQSIHFFHQLSFIFL